MNYIGSIIKDLRISFKMTQAELAKDICSVKQLSRIEQNESNPTVYIFSQLSLKLGNSLNDYLPYSDDPKGYFIKEEIDMALNLYYKHKADESYDLIITSPLLQNTISTYAQKEIAWLLGVVMHHHSSLSNNIDARYFEKMLDIEDDFSDLFSRYLTPLDYRIINSLACLYDREKHLELTIYLLESALQNFEKNYTHITDSSYLLLIYNLALARFDQYNFVKAKELSEKGIIHCMNTNTVFLLANFYLLCGESLYALNKEVIGKEYLQNYIHLRKLYKPGSTPFYEKTIDYVKEKYNIM